jgi:two-component system, chemotaxis family, protein-glutamate methylesterase/glutaminase
MAEDELKNTWIARLRKLLVIGGSAGSLALVLKIISLLQKEADVSVILVIHRMSSTEDSVLLEVLTSKTSFEVKEVEDKDQLQPGVIYVAPSDYHLLVEKDGSLTLDDSEKVNFSRPSIDVTFESAAEVCGPSLVCVLLSGANADGAIGLKKVKEKGGRVIIQDPATAEFPFMPQKALELVEPDLLLNDKDVQKIVAHL